ncbi:arylsulfatase B-like [Ptychodera flava]|uniref:arylsulfatase B-like n=1 Tax=Ptychodera flava TaxID=63121 RepID=UPI00396A0CDF
MSVDWGFKVKTVVLWMTAIYFQSAISRQQEKQPPHIILIVVDDWGWDDVSLHGSDQIPTPNIDALAHQGVILHNYYVQPICTPTRGALMTGRHPIHLGLQHDVIYGAQPYGLRLNETIMPQYFHNLGYTTHMIGKWHLGFFTEDHTPTHRGFETHFGYYCGHEDYYDRLAGEGKYWGYDMRRNGVLDYSTYNQYATDLFTMEALKTIGTYANSTKPLFLYLAHLGVHAGNDIYPLQAPDSYTSRFPNIKSEKRKLLAGMVAAVDDSIGYVVQALQANGMYNNSIVVVTTDNGGPTNGYDGNDASNWPLRGCKHTLWEGGVRGTGFVHSPLLSAPGRVTTEMMHVCDWLPTLYHAAGGDIKDLPGNLDGFNLWDTLSSGVPSPRTEILHNIDPVSKTAALRVGSYKIVIGEDAGGHYDGWYKPDEITDENQSFKRGNSSLKSPLKIDCGPKPENASTNCKPAEKPCLYDISKDPCEFTNLADKLPDVLEKLLSILDAYNATSVEPMNPALDPAADPAKHNGAWVPWVNPASAEDVKKYGRYL